jgi:hypothetical protein
MKQITKCHALQVHVVVKKSRKPKTLGGVFVCVCVWCPLLHCGLAFRSVWFSLCMIHMKHTSWDAADTFI